MKLTSSYDEEDPEHVLSNKWAFEVALQFGPEDVHGGIEEKRVRQEYAQGYHDLEHLPQPVGQHVISSTPLCCNQKYCC